MESEKHILRLGIAAGIEEEKVAEIIRDLVEFDIAVVRKPVGDLDADPLALLKESGFDALLLPLNRGLSVPADEAGPDSPGSAPAGIEWFVPRSALSGAGEKVVAGEGEDRLLEPALFFPCRHALLLQLRKFYVPSVAFIGGGPGDPGLCTVAGVEALRHCDVCLYDALVPGSLLTELPLRARPVYVGKRCGKHSHHQAEICALLAAYARRGLRVVRLKGGDPGIFGRLAEEIEIFDRFQLPYRVVPGVSSLLAATTGTGMFLTRRNISRGFTVLTPRHAADRHNPVYGKEGELPPRPVVFFMAMGRIKALVKSLKKRGRSEDEPAAVVWGASTPEEKIVRGTLGDIAARVKEYDGDLPGIFMLGVTTTYGLERGWSVLQDDPVLLLVRAGRLKAACEEVLAFGGKPVVPPPLLELSGVERRKPFFSSVICSDSGVEEVYRKQWGELPAELVRSGDDELGLVRALARDRIREELGMLPVEDPCRMEGEN